MANFKEWCKKALSTIKDALSKAFSYIGSDGLSHIVVSALLLVALGWVRPLYIATLVVLTIGVGKEVYDHFKTNPTHDHFHDLLCDCIGIALGLVIVFINSL